MITYPNRAAFVAAFGHLFEHSPWVVERAWARQPFADAKALHAAFMREVEAAGEAVQLGLIRAHPELAMQIGLTAESEAEQAGAGLKTLTPHEYKRFAALNEAYRQKFDFPFIVCVRLHNKSSIFAAYARRLRHDRAAEFAQALREIGHITRLRLADMRIQITA